MRPWIQKLVSEAQNRNIELEWETLDKQKKFNPKKAKLNENGDKFSKSDFNKKARSQGYRCEICREKPPKLVTDHDHTSGLVRGLLCSNCNTGLGFFKDSISIVILAARYLRNYRIYKKF